MSAGRPRSRRRPPARAVWFPAMPTHRPVFAEPGQRGPHIRVQVLVPEPLRLALIGTLLPGLVQVESRLEDLEGLPVVLAARDDRAEHRREHMTRNTQPVSPRPVLPRLIHQAFADIENDSTDHAATLRQLRHQAEIGRVLSRLHCRLSRS